MKYSIYKKRILILKNKRGTINEYFNDWESESMNIKKGFKNEFYNEDFITARLELKNYSYESFINNFKSWKSQRRKALRMKG